MELLKKPLTIACFAWRESELSFLRVRRALSESKRRGLELRGDEIKKYFCCDSSKKELPVVS